MPVPIQQPYSRSIANGVTTVFPFEFYVINASDIRVSVDNVEVDSGYSISGVGNVSGGDVIFLTPPVNGAVVLLERAMPLSRQTDYQDNGDFLAETVNRDFDRIWMVLQSNAVSLGLSLSIPLSGGPYDAGDTRIANVGDPEQPSDAANKKFVETTVSNGLKSALRTPEEISPFPSAATRRNRIPAFDSNGDVITIPPPSGSAAEVYIELAKPTGAGLVGTTSGKTVQQELDGTLKGANNLADIDDPEQARDNIGITKINQLLTEHIEQVNTDSVNRDNSLGGRIDDVNSNKRNCTAWVFFNGVNAQIWDAYNVSSVVRLSTGHYDILFAEPMNHTSYSYTFGTGDSSTTGTLGAILLLSGSPTGTPAKKDIYGVHLTNRSSGGVYDGANISAVFHGGK